MREAGLNKARTVHVYTRDNILLGYQKQVKLMRHSGTMQDIAKTAFKLFKEVYSWEKPVRSLGISVSDFIFGNEQLDLFGDLEKDEKQKRLDTAIDKLRAKYGNNIIQTATVYKDPKLKNIDVKGEHTIHPYSFFKNK